MLIPNFGFIYISHMNIYCCCLHKVNKLVEIKMILEACFQMLIKVNNSSQEYQVVSKTELDHHDATEIVVTTSNKCEFPSAPPTNEQVKIIEDLAGKFAVQLSMPQDGF